MSRLVSVQTPGPPDASPRGPITSCSLAVVDPDAGFCDAVAAHLGGEVWPFGTVSELDERLTGAAPVVAVLGPACAGWETLTRVSHLVGRFPMVGVVLVAEEVTTPLLQQALRAGVRDVVPLDADPELLGDAVRRVAGTVEHVPLAPMGVVDRVLADLPPVDSSPADPPPAEPLPAEPLPAEPAEPAAEPGDHRGAVVTVFSPKGGSGTTVVATSLAVALAERSERPVCIVDADLQFGDVAVLLHASPSHTIVDAVAAIDRLDATMLESMLVTHASTGVRLLAAPLEPADADRVGAADLVRVIEILRGFCEFVVVDTPSHLDERVLSVLDESDSIELVAGLDIPSVKNLKVTLQTLRLLGLPEERLHLVLNRADSSVQLEVSEVERALQFTARVRVPSDVVVPRSVNSGEPVVAHAPRSGVAKAIAEIADCYVAPRPTRRRWRK